MTVLCSQWDFLYGKDNIFILNQGPGERSTSMRYWWAANPELQVRQEPHARNSLQEASPPCSPIPVRLITEMMALTKQIFQIVASYHFLSDLYIESGTWFSWSQAYGNRCPGATPDMGSSSMLPNPHQYVIPPWQPSCDITPPYLSILHHIIPVILDSLPLR